MKDLKFLALLSVLAFGLLTVSISKAESKLGNQDRFTQLKKCDEIKFLNDGTGYTLNSEGKILMITKESLPDFCKEQASAKGLIPRAQ